MTEEIRIKTRDWERLLSYTQQQKYKTAIKQGWFANYHSNAWRHDTFYGAYIWKYPKFIKVVRMFEEMLGHKPLWEDITDDNLRDLFEKIQEKLKAQGSAIFKNQVTPAIDPANYRQQ